MTSMSRLQFLSVACGQHENVLMKIFGHRGDSWIGRLSWSETAHFQRVVERPP